MDGNNFKPMDYWLNGVGDINDDISSYVVPDDVVIFMNLDRYVDLVGELYFYKGIVEGYMNR